MNFKKGDILIYASDIDFYEQPPQKLIFDKYGVTPDGQTNYAQGIDTEGNSFSPCYCFNSIAEATEHYTERFDYNIKYIQEQKEKLITAIEKLTAQSPDHI